MSIGLHFYQGADYRVATPVFEGPLDLLLHLIERAELDITKLALAQVTDQYLRYLDNLPEHNAEDVSAFLVIAARLLQIKSEALLPRPPTREPGEEDPGDALARQLQFYKRFKEIALFLGRRQKDGWRTFLRLAPPPKIEGKVDLSDVGINDLIQAAQDVFTIAIFKAEQNLLDNVVAAPPVTIRQKIGQITNILRQRGHITFGSLLEGARSRLDIVVAFLAMLELVKLHFVEVRQERTFGEIAIDPSDTWDMAEEFELEFGE